MTSIDQAIEAAKKQFFNENPESLKYHEAAAGVLPGSNTRATIYHAPFPLRMKGGHGCILSSVDGRDYIDMIGEFTAGMYGHSNEAIRKELIKTLEDGINLGAHTPHEIELAHILVNMIPCFEQVRFTNSGTEANIFNLALAKAFTKRSKILVFAGGYHGGVVTFRGDETDKLINVPHDWVMCTYNNVEDTRKTIQQVGSDLAAVLVEPMQGSFGCVAGKPEFLEMLRQETSAAGALLIFDEVMTSRLHYGGLQKKLGITPDLTSVGKYLGGGMSFGCIGGRKDIMALYDPSSPNAMTHGGTFNNNVLSMRAGVVALRDVLTPQKLDKMNALGDDLRNKLNALAQKYGIKLKVTGLGSMMTVHWTDGPIENANDVGATNNQLRDLFFIEMLNSGVYFAKKGFLALTLEHTQQHIDTVVDLVEKFIVKHKQYLQ